LIECASEFDVVDYLNSTFIRCVEFLLRAFTGIEKFQQDAEIIDNRFDGFKIGNPMLICFDLLERDLRPLRLCPEIRIERELLVFC
jgi:hypothetical protein